MALGIHETVFKFKRETLPIRMASKHVRSFSYPISPGGLIGSPVCSKQIRETALLQTEKSTQMWNRSPYSNKGFYRRVLPSPPAIEFGSSEGKKLFAEAYEAGHMEGYFKLSPCYQTQSEPAYCGLASLSMVLNALGIDPGRKWKGPWRWFDEHMLDCCESLEKIKSEGISFGKLACLAYYNGAKVGAFRTNQSTITDFHKYVMTCTSSEDCHVITSFYRPHLKLGCIHESWTATAKHLSDNIPFLLKLENFKDAQEVLSTTLMSLPINFWEFIKWVEEFRRREEGASVLSKEMRGLSVKDQVLSQVHETELYKHVTKWLSSQSSHCTTSNDASCCNGIYPAINEIVTVLLLALPPSTWSGLKDAELLKEIYSLVSIDSLPLSLQEEVLNLRRHLVLITDLGKPTL